MNEVLENLKMWPSDPLCVAAAKQIEEWTAENERLRIGIRDHAGVELSEENDRLIDEIKRLRAALKQACRQWAMYADMVERNDGFDLAKEQSPEADMYRAAVALCGDEQTAD